MTQFFIPGPAGDTRLERSEDVIDTLRLRSKELERQRRSREQECLVICLAAIAALENQDESAPANAERRLGELLSSDDNLAVAGVLVKTASGEGDLPERVAAFAEDAVQKAMANLKGLRNGLLSEGLIPGAPRALIRLAAPYMDEDIIPPPEHAEGYSLGTVKDRLLKILSSPCAFSEGGGMSEWQAQEEAMIVLAPFIASDPEICRAFCVILTRLDGVMERVAAEKAHGYLQPHENIDAVRKAFEEAKVLRTAELSKGCD